MLYSRLVSTGNHSVTLRANTNPRHVNTDEFFDEEAIILSFLREILELAY